MYKKNHPWPKHTGKLLELNFEFDPVKFVKMEEIKNTNDTKQVTFQLTRKSVLFWRRLILIRYYARTSRSADVNVIWSDFDKKNRILTLGDELTPFSEKIPDTNLFKSIVQLSNKGVKLLTITLYYTTNSCLVQGNVCQSWVQHEFDYIKKTVNLALKGDKPRAFDLRIKNMRPPNFNVKDMTNPISILSDNDHHSSDEHDESLDISHETDPKRLVQVVSENENAQNLPDIDAIISSKNCDDMKSDSGSIEKLVSSLLVAIHKLESKFVDAQLENKKSIEKLTTEVQKINQKIEREEAQIPETKTVFSHEIIEKVVKSANKAGIEEMGEKFEKLSTKLNKIQNDDLPQVVQEIKGNASCVNNEITKLGKNLDDKNTKFQKNLQQIEALCCDIKIDITRNERKTTTQEQNKGTRRDSDIYYAENNDESGHFHSPNNNRQSSHEKENRVKVWVVGSSLVKDLNPKKIYRYQSTKITPLHDKTIYGARGFLESGRLNAENIVYQIGSNDLENNSVDKVLADMENLVLNTQRLVPGSNIIINELLPRYYSDRNLTEEYERKRLELNTRLEIMCDDLRLKFVKHKNLLQKHFRDGIHLDRFTGTGIYVRNLKRIVNPLIGVVGPEDMDRSVHNPGQSFNGRNRQQSTQQNRPPPFNSRPNQMGQWKNRFDILQNIDPQISPTNINYRLLKLALGL